MKKYLATLMLLSSSAFAQFDPSAPQDLPVDDNVYVENGVITQITATPINGGINPSQGAVLLEGTIKAGGNSCEGQRYEVGIREVMIRGRLHLRPFVQEKAGSEAIICIALLDLDYKGLAFSQAVRASANKLKNAVVENVGAVGRTVKLSTLPASVPSDEPAREACDDIAELCTKIYDRHTCSAVANGDVIAVEGNNRCEALINLRKAFCKVDKVLKVDDAQCTRDTSGF
jgi:hypothetical protein